MYERPSPTILDVLTTSGVGIVAGVIAIGLADDVVGTLAAMFGAPEGTRYTKTGAGSTTVLEVAMLASLLVTFGGAVLMPRLRERFETLGVETRSIASPSRA